MQKSTNTIQKKKFRLNDFQLQGARRAGVLGSGSTFNFITRRSGERGAAMMISLIFFILASVLVVLGLTGPSARQYKIANEALTSRQSYFLSESGVEDAFYRLKNSMTLPSSVTLVLGSSSTVTTITNLSGGQKQIVGTSDVNDNNRAVDLVVTTGAGVAFNYGMQVGNGGLSMSNSARIIGNVYANGDITGNNSASITGTAFAADRSSQVVDQTNDTGTPSHSITFANASATQDSAQSFQTSISDTATQVEVYIKKVGSPSNLTVRITADSSGKPASSSLTTGTISASTVTTSYGWATVALSPNVTLTAGTTYWIVLDGSANTSNYYIWGANSAGYASGLGKTGTYGTTTWNNTSPSGLDGFFKMYLGGVNSTISGMTIGTGSVGNAWAHTVTGSTIAGSLYCQTGSSNNKSCNTSLGDPTPLDFPISTAQITDWKADALAGGTLTGSYSLSGSSTATLGPKKIVGNLYVSNSGVLTVSGTLWVTGNVVLSNSAIVKLASGYGSGSGMIIADGTISTSNSASFAGSGTTGSYMMMLTTSSSSTAINVANSAGTVILVAPNGTIVFSNTAGAKEAVAYRISMSNSATLTYDSGLANVNFVLGPSGSYTVDSWKETQ